MSAMLVDDDDLAEFLHRYTDACADAGVEPLPPADLANLAEFLLTSAGLADRTLH